MGRKSSRRRQQQQRLRFQKAAAAPDSAAPGATSVKAGSTAIQECGVVSAALLTCDNCAITLDFCSTHAERVGACLVCGCPNVSYTYFDADEFADAGLQIFSKCRFLCNLKIISDCDPKWASMVRKATAFYDLCVRITLQNQVFDFVAPRWNIRGIFV